jgi:hypothetical protein
MKRRHFIHAAAASLLLPLDLEPRGASPAAGSPHLDYAFFDERFQNARRVAASWPALNGPLAVQGHGTADGPGTMQLRRTRGADKALLTERTDLTSEYITFIVRHGLRSMPPFVPSDLTDTKLKALVGFLMK